MKGMVWPMKGKPMVPGGSFMDLVLILPLILKVEMMIRMMKDNIISGEKKRRRSIAIEVYKHSAKISKSLVGHLCVCLLSGEVWEVWEGCVEC